MGKSYNVESTTMYSKKENYQLDFFAYELQGTDVFLDSECKHRLISFCELQKDMTVYAHGPLGELRAFTVTERKHHSWHGEDEHGMLVSGEYQHTRYEGCPDVATNQISGWAATCFGDKRALERVDFQ